MPSTTSRTTLALTIALAATVAACADRAPLSAPRTPPHLSQSQGTYSGPKSVPTRGRILFYTDVTGDEELYSMKEDGTEIVRLTYSAGTDVNGTFSPDGRKIAFGSTRDGSFHLYVMNSDGSGVKRLTTIAPPASPVGIPSWSPDGKKVVFSVRTGVGQDPDYDIYIMSANGAGVRQLTAGADEDLSPSFSPDGMHIVFASKRTGSYEIWTMNVDGSNPTQLTNCGLLLQTGCKQPAWSPDGTQVAFSDENFQIHLLRLANSGISTIASGGAGPIWSPDGLKLVYAISPSIRNVASINVDGTGFTALTGFAQNTVPSSWGR